MSWQRTKIFLILAIVTEKFVRTEADIFFLTDQRFLDQDPDDSMPYCQPSTESHSGFLKSPNHPDPYLPNTKCIYEITKTKPEQCGVRLSFLSLEMEDADDDGFCKRDWLAVDSCVPEGGARFCGNKTTNGYYFYPFQKDAKAFTLTLKTNGEKEKSGFVFEYDILTDCSNMIYWKPPVSAVSREFFKSTMCYANITETQGTFNSPNYPSRYTSNVDCVYEFFRSSPRVCGIQMQVIEFQLPEPIETDFGGACVDFFHTPGCGFLCGFMEFRWVARFQPGASSILFHFHTEDRSAHKSLTANIKGFRMAFQQTEDCEGDFNIL